MTPNSPPGTPPCPTGFHSSTERQRSASGDRGNALPAHNRQTPGFRRGTTRRRSAGPEDQFSELIARHKGRGGSAT
jgi:hypothetical protein